MQSNQANVAHCLVWLWRNVFSRRRRLQAGLVIVFVVIGAVAEVITIGAVIPFLAIFADPEGFGSSSRFAPLIASLGIPSSSFSLRTIGLTFCGIAIGAAIVRIML